MMSVAMIMMVMARVMTMVMAMAMMLWWYCDAENDGDGSGNVRAVIVRASCWQWCSWRNEVVPHLRSQWVVAIAVHPFHPSRAHVHVRVFVHLDVWWWVCKQKHIHIVARIHYT